MQLGTLAAREGRFDKAVEFLDEALRLDGSLGPAHLLRAKALFQTGDVPAAIVAFQEACRWLPQSFEAHYNLGVILRQQGRLKEARPFLERAMDIDPQNELVERIRAELADG